MKNFLKSTVLSLASNSLLESLVFAERAAKKMAAEWAAEGLVENADRKETATEPKEDENDKIQKRIVLYKKLVAILVTIAGILIIMALLALTVLR